MQTSEHREDVYRKRRFDAVSCYPLRKIKHPAKALFWRISSFRHWFFGHRKMHFWPSKTCFDSLLCGAFGGVRAKSNGFGIF